MLSTLLGISIDVKADGPFSILNMLSPIKKSPLVKVTLLRETHLKNALSPFNKDIIIIIIFASKIEGITKFYL